MLRRLFRCPVIAPGRMIGRASSADAPGEDPCAVTGIRAISEHGERLVELEITVGCGFQWWVWPLPPAGPLEFICQWPVYGIGETRVGIDGQVILDAARLSVQLWPEDG